MTMEATFAELVEPYRQELRLHCYRLVGSLTDADDLVQDTMLAAWRGLDGFAGRAALRTWLYRIATNRSLNALRDSSRRPLHTVADLPEPTLMAEPLWLQPYPVSEPESRYESRETIGLAFTTLLQRLPPRQRATGVLCDVLGFGLSEAAEVLDATGTAVKGMLARARATLAARRDYVVPAHSLRERELAGLFAAALNAGDVDALVSLLTDDAWLTMPPQPYAYQGRVAIAGFFRDRALHRGFAELPGLLTSANGQPAVACYTDRQPYGLLVLTVTVEGISAITAFRDTSVFPYFGLPATL